MKLRTATILRMRDTLLTSGRRPTIVLSNAFETLARQGLFEQDEIAAINRIEPIAEAMFLMMSVDGKITASERDAVRGAIRGLSGDVLRSGTINVMLEKFEGRMLKYGKEQRLQEIAEALSPERAEAECAFALAAAVALADDEVADEENDFINQLADWFGITETRATEILEQLERDRSVPE